METTAEQLKPVTKKEKLFVATQWQLIRWRFFRHKMAIAALVVIGLFYLGAVFSEFFSPYDPRHHDVDYIYAPPQRPRFVYPDGRFRLRPFVYGLRSELNLETFLTTYHIDREKVYPIRFFVRGDPYETWGIFKGNMHFMGVEEGNMFLLGTDSLGRDLVSRIIFGGRISMTIGLVGIAMQFVIGIILGGISGYFGGTVDTVIQRVIEFIMSLPTLPLWMGLSAALPPWLTMLQLYFAIVFILSLMGWTGTARVVRGKFMALKEEDFVMAARLNGCSKARIIGKHLLPSFYSHIIASLTLSIPGTILGETSLSFIGLGLQPPAISWGVLLQDAQSLQALTSYPWLLLPGLFVIISVLGFNFVGDGLRDAADPYSKI